MKKTLLQKSLWLLVLVFVFQSCTTDDDDLVVNQDTDTDTNEPNDSSLSTNLIIEWSELFLEVDRYATGMRPNATARSIAYINLAAYETAIPFMDRYRSQAERLTQFSVDLGEFDDFVNPNIALNACYKRVMNHFMYNIPDDVEESIDAFAEVKFDELSDGVDEDVIRNSQRWGTYIARLVIAYSQTDREAEQQQLEPQPTSYEPPVGDGNWTYSAEEERGLFPYWSSVRTFVISPQQTSTVAPEAYSENPNSNYYAQMVEVYEVSTTAAEEENEDLWIAEFWSDDVEGLMMSPPGRQVSIAKQLIEQTDLEAEDALALLLKLGFSLNDAAVSTWADKYEYLVMRPNVFIHEFIDPDYQTNLYPFIYWPNPTFPGYPSGHSCFASAAAGVFIDQFGNNIQFTDRSHEGRDEFRGDPRNFSSLSQMAEENAFSRIPLGVHIRMDCEEGLRLGYEIADAVNNLDVDL